MESFTINERTNDLFLGSVTKLPFSTSEFKDVFKNTLIFSRGNACVKAGLSLNELILATYMKEQSLIAQRIFHEGVSEKVVFWRWNMLSDMKQSWKFADTAEAENKEH